MEQVRLDQVRRQAGEEAIAIQLATAVFLVVEVVAEG